MTAKEDLKVVMAFDFGMKKMGVAIGQTVTQTARPLTTLPMKSGHPNWQSIKQLVQKWAPQAFVVGIPLNMDGTEQAISTHARNFANALQVHYNLPVFAMDERLTTKDAKEQLFSRGGFKALQDGQVDQVAAQLILQTWFTENFK